MPVNEQAEELNTRFSKMVPGVIKDPRFAVGVAEIEPNGMFPFVYLAAEPGPGEEMPPMYIKVIKVAENKFRLFFVGFYIVMGTAAGFYPRLVSSEELDATILWVWEQRDVLEAAIEAELARFNELLNGPEALPL